jgi:hypothetical protein
MINIKYKVFYKKEYPVTINKIFKLIFVGCITSLTLQSLAVATRIKVTNETLKTIVLYFDSMIYKRPQVETLLPTQTRSIYLEDYSDKDITKNITIEARQTSGDSTTWSFAQTDLRTNMTLIFSHQNKDRLKLTIIRPNGTTRIVDPITR